MVLDQESDLSVYSISIMNREIKIDTDTSPVFKDRLKLSLLWEG